MLNSCTWLFWLNSFPLEYSFRACVSSYRPILIRQAKCKQTVITSGFHNCLYLARTTLYNNATVDLQLQTCWPLRGMLVCTHYAVSASFPPHVMSDPVFHVEVTFITCHLNNAATTSWYQRDVTLWREGTKSSTAPVIICSGKVNQDHKTRTGNHQHLLWRCKAARDK